ncbi:hypothetical protein [Thiothrix nivea]|uniref:hypothetical protein n=1 Tax=Thiothrix nivea TaxID=1031 RepID=UPI0012B69935|nr:hypothetical protein [Thiothrix nivea]
MVVYLSVLCGHHFMQKLMQQVILPDLKSRKAISFPEACRACLTVKNSSMDAALGIFFTETALVNWIITKCDVVLFVLGIG